MGRAKEMMIRESEKGFRSRDTWVCTSCIGDDALKRYIRRNGEQEHACSYCDEESRGRKAVPFDVFVTRVLEGLQSEWGDPNDEGVAWEKGWVGEVFDTYDILTEEVEIGFRSEALFEHTHFSLGDHQWCQKNFYELEPHQALSAGWEEFSNLVKHESRYVFFRKRDERASGRGSEEVPPSAFLDELGHLLHSLRLYSVLPAGTETIRVRIHHPDIKLSTHVELGPPPAKLARFPNRMSAAGITAFYSAFDVETALAETVMPESRSPMLATAGTFQLQRDLLLVDFRSLPPVPSVFEPDSRSRRHGIRFLRRFLQDFEAPVVKDGREHVEYVPTQIIAEYLRFVHQDPKGQPINGILYNSARKRGSHACVLFLGPENIAGDRSNDGEKTLLLCAVQSLEVPAA